MIREFKKKFLSLFKENKLTFLHAPFIDKNDLQDIRTSILSKQVSTYGNITKKFETKLGSYLKSKYIFCTNTGTSAIHLALKAIDLRRDQEVLVSALTFVGTVNPIIYCNAIPHFCDIDLETLAIDPKKLDHYLKKIVKFKKDKPINKNTGKEIKAILITHVYGFAAKIVEIANIAKKYNIHLVEDAAEALGTKYKQKNVGTFGSVGIFSFNGNKIITTGGGGAVVTNNKNIYEKAHFLGTTAKKNNTALLSHLSCGYNYRMPSLNAALGISQLRKIKKILKQKKKLHNFYMNQLKCFDEIILFNKIKNTQPNYWLNTIIFKTLKKKKILELIKYFKKNKIETRPTWELMNTLKYMKKYPRMKDLKNSKYIQSKTMVIPSGDHVI